MEPIWQWGIQVIVGVQQFRAPALDAVMRAFTFLGNEEFYILLMPFLLWCVDFRMGLRLGVIFLLSVVLNGVLKDALAQPRPFELNPAVGVDRAEGGGLPSGHAQSAVVVWGTVAGWTRSRWVQVVAILLIFFIGLSRVYLGVHFPTDVIAGWVIGAVLLGIFVAVLPAALRAANALGRGLQVLAALVLPAALAALHPTRDIVAAMGVLAGTGIGVGLAHRAFGFSAAGPWPQRVARFLLGGVIVAALYVGLREAFPGDTSPYYFVFRFIRYGSLGLWAVLGAPWLFVRLRLTPATPS